MKIHVYRTAMCGGGLHYDVYVPEAECPGHVLKACPNNSYYTRIGREWKGNRYTYLDYEHATLPVEFEAIPLGMNRYDTWLAHEHKARLEMLAIATMAFPELKNLAHKSSGLPTLWTNGLLEPETSAFKKLEIDLDDFREMLNEACGIPRHPITEQS